ncbi:23S rRNA (adenine(2503)-C(2))-methyltransferase RlmN [Candidatus Woesearchaeota archaeon]|nr:23S rRNA (adenine(2503)-C(2))-methyltransferase RlmN [Candidatus Woesearchaeota archaeon]
MRIVSVAESDDGTKKFLIELDDGKKIESVAIFHKQTICACVSSQVGCAMKCSFCATGKMGFHRNLSCDEIVGQLDLIEENLGQKVTNIVFMGMGEPLMNYDNVVSAVKKMNERLSWKKITVSTVGLPDRIVQLGKDAKCRLALSLHAASDELRTKLVPSNMGIKNIVSACLDFPATKHNPVMVEYILIKNINDDPAGLIAFLKQLPHVMVNLIPYNPVGEFSRPSDEEVLQFKQALIDAGFKTIVRTQKGVDSNAACGMLATKDL